MFLLASAMILPQLPTGFVPKGDTGMSQLDVMLPPSSTLAQTDEILQKFDRTIRQLRVASTNGGIVPLNTFADIQFWVGSASLALIIQK